MKALDRAIVILSIVDIVILLFGGLFVYFSYFYNKLDFKEYKGNTIEVVSFGEKYPSMEYIILQINEQTHTNYKIQFDTEFTGGYTRLLSNTIYINPTLTKDSFAWTYAHEVLHHKYFTHDERFVQFETFKFMYENKIKFFRYSAMIELRFMGNRTKEYDVRYYIYNYLKEKGVDTNEVWSVC